MNNLKLSGVGSVNGGVYDNIHIDGVAKIHSDVEFNEMKIDGVVTVKGSCDGFILFADGLVKFKDDINCTQVYLNGVINAKTINAEEVKGSVSGLKVNDIYADTINLKVNNKNVINGIYGENVSIVETRRKLGKKTVINEIVADNIKLEGITVNKVQGKNVELINCKVDTVIYNKSLIKTNSKIKKETKN